MSNDVIHVLTTFIQTSDVFDLYIGVVLGWAGIRYHLNHMTWKLVKITIRNDLLTMILIFFLLHGIDLNSTTPLPIEVYVYPQIGMLAPILATLLAWSLIFFRGAMTVPKIWLSQKFQRASEKLSSNAYAMMKLRSELSQTGDQATDVP